MSHYYYIIAYYYKKTSIVLVIIVICRFYKEDIRSLEELLVKDENLRSVSM